jgi:hypothetical protein
MFSKKLLGMDMCDSDGVRMITDQKTGKKLPVLIKRSRGMGGGIQAETMIPSLILERRKMDELARHGSTTAGGTMREPMRTAMKLKDMEIMKKLLDSKANRSG